MSKIVLAIISVGLLFGIVVIFSQNDGTVESDGNNVEVRDGTQYVTIDAKGGYLPSVTEAEAGIPTKLIVETNGTYDCSAALVVREAKFQQILPPTGKTEIDLGVKEVGESVDGVCGMGMYSFKINFVEREV